MHTVNKGGAITHVLTIVNDEQLGRILERVMDPNEFLSDYGIRSLSKAHEAHPFVFEGQAVGYEPAEAITRFKGGNSNWRGPIWFPTCFLLDRVAAQAGHGVRPRGHAGLRRARSAKPVTFGETAQSLAERLIRIFTRDPATGRRAVSRRSRKLPGRSPLERSDSLLRVFPRRLGAGLGASHQTGWTALVASLIDEWREH